MSHIGDVMLTSRISMDTFARFSTTKITASTVRPSANHWVGEIRENNERFFVSAISAPFVAAGPTSRFVAGEVGYLTREG